MELRAAPEFTGRSLPNERQLKWLLEPLQNRRYESAALLQSCKGNASTPTIFRVITPMSGRPCVRICDTRGQIGTNQLLNSPTV